ncbi:DUF4845 domain-containing protein [uncultured Ramlibacter sp.]|uniref:DUF4845 domain-containing protein n=1 Tax=uncultured Ramlibacter sp. TaxID=260755 RepID=UPI002635DD0E|nr:DUF4845 domain-containing protein [uncultured Ramlibacter sp.]
MGHKFKSGQRGVSFFTLVFLIAVLVGLGALAAQAVPTAIEYQAILKAVEKSKAGGSIPEVKTIFDKAAQIDDIKSITAKDLEVTKAGDKWLVKFAYNKEIHMFGPAYLLLKYAGQSK